MTLVAKHTELALEFNVWSPLLYDQSLARILRPDPITESKKASGRSAACKEPAKH
jgi:hypothetical protein